MWDDIFPSRASAIANPLEGMASSADLEELRRKQAQAAWAAGAGSPRSMNTDDLLNAYDNKRLAPMSGSSPAYSTPQVSSPFSVPASVSDLVPSRASAIAGSTPDYGGFVGPIDTFVGPRPDDDGRAGPRMDASVNGLLPAAEWNQGGWNGSQASPYAALDNFMSRDPVHILGVNGFRTGASRPSVDYSGPMQRQQAIRNNMDMEAMLGRQDIARNANNLDAMRFSLASQDRQDAIRQRSLRDFEMSYGKTPVGSRGSLVDAYSSVLPAPVANKLALEDIVGGAIIDAGHLDSDKRPKSMEGFARSIGKRFDPNRHDANGLMQQLTGMGITRDDIEKMRGKPGMEWINRLDTNQLPAAPESFLKWFMKPMM